MAAFDLSKFTGEMWSMGVVGAMSTLPSLRQIILNEQAFGAGTVHFPYIAGLTAAHKADGAALTYQAGTASGFDVVVDKSPHLPIMIGNLARYTSQPGWEVKAMLQMAYGMLKYEDDLIFDGIAGITPTTVKTADLSALTTDSDISDQLAVEMGKMRGFLQILNTVPWDNCTWLVDPLVAHTYMTGEKFTNANFKDSLGGVAYNNPEIVKGLVGSFTGAGIVSYRSSGSSALRPIYASGPANTSFVVLLGHKDMAGLATPKEVEVRQAYNPTYNEDQIVASAVQGFGAGRADALAKLTVTVDGNPFGL